METRRVFARVPSHKGYFELQSDVFISFPTGLLFRYSELDVLYMYVSVTELDFPHACVINPILKLTAH